MPLPSSVGIVHTEDDRRKLVAVDVCVENISEEFECVQWKRHFGEILAFGYFMICSLTSRYFHQDILMFCRARMVNNGSFSDQDILIFCRANVEEWFGF